MPIGLCRDEVSRDDAMSEVEFSLRDRSAK